LTSNPTFALFGATPPIAADELLILDDRYGAAGFARHAMQTIPTVNGAKTAANTEVDSHITNYYRATICK